FWRAKKKVTRPRGRTPRLTIANKKHAEISRSNQTKNHPKKSKTQTAAPATHPLIKIKIPTSSRMDSSQELPEPTTATPSAA
ncbi:MAG: hypothetical protein Q7S85_02265, partial [Rugosibacter sp.]|nr:hypothetical protein [Rugosibacter sp.]